MKNNTQNMMTVIKKAAIIAIMLLFGGINGFGQISAEMLECVCASGSFGAAQVVVEPSGTSAGPFTVKWEGPNGYFFETPLAYDAPFTSQVSNLPEPGMYFITVTNAYMCEIPLSVYVPACASVFPYVKKVIAKAIISGGDNQNVYDAEWVVEGDCISYTGGAIPVNIDNISQIGLNVIAELSQPVEGDLDIELPGAIFQVGNVSNSNDTLTWTYNFQQGTLGNLANLPEMIQQMVFIAPNLLNLHELSNNMQNCVELPQLSDDCMWEEEPPIGKDRTHVLEFSCLHIDYEVTNVSNSGANDGAISLIIEGGVPPYSFYWYQGPSINSGNNGQQNLTHLAAGEYCVQLKDQNGCEKIICINVGVCDQVEVEPTIIPACENGGGSICAAIYSNGVPSQSAYSFAWSNGVTQEGASSCIQNLSPATYFVTITDMNCDLTFVTMFELPISNPTISGNVTDACGIQASGSIQVYVQGGQPPYSYSWMDENGNVGNQSFINGLSQGEYSLTVKDNCGAIVSASFMVNSINTSLEVKSDITHVCSGGTGGAISLNISGDAPPYDILWNTGATGNMIINLSAGQYSVVITDACGFEFPYSFTVEQSPVTNFSTDIVQPINQLPGCEGMITIVPNSNVAGPFTYNWSNGLTGASINNLCPDTYIAMITDNNECEYELEIELEVECVKLPSISAGVTDAKNCNDGRIKINAITGFGPLDVVWDYGLEPNAGNYINDLYPGDYSVTITDAAGCTAIETFTIDGPAEGFSNAFIIDESILYACEGMSNGSAEILVALTGGYTVEWDNGETGNIATNLSAGLHTVTVTGTNTPDCLIVKEVEIPEVDVESLELFSVVQNTCADKDIGYIDLTINGGVSPISFHWNDTNFSLEDRNELKEGTYCVTVTDHCGTSVSDCFTIISFSDVVQPPINQTIFQKLIKKY